MKMICSKKIGEKLTIDSNDLYDYIGSMTEHTKISQEDLFTIFRCVLFLTEKNKEMEGK